MIQRGTIKTTTITYVRINVSLHFGSHKTCVYHLVYHLKEMVAFIYKQKYTNRHISVSPFPGHRLIRVILSLTGYLESQKDTNLTHGYFLYS